MHIEANVTRAWCIWVVGWSASQRGYGRRAFVEEERDMTLNWAKILSSEGPVFRYVLVVKSIVRVEGQDKWAKI